LIFDASVEELPDGALANGQPLSLDEPPRVSGDFVELVL
jgi:hypothetical protein